MDSKRAAQSLLRGSFDGATCREPLARRSALWSLKRCLPVWVGAIRDAIAADTAENGSGTREIPLELDAGIGPAKSAIPKQVHVRRQPRTRVRGLAEECFTVYELSKIRHWDVRNHVAGCVG